MSVLNLCKSIKLIFIFLDDCAVPSNQQLLQFLSKESFAQIKLVSEMYKKNKSRSVEEQLKEACEQDSKLFEAYSTIGKHYVQNLFFFLTMTKINLYALMEIVSFSSYTNKHQS